MTSARLTGIMPHPTTHPDIGSVLPSDDVLLARNFPLPTLSWLVQNTHRSVQNNVGKGTPPANSSPIKTTTQKHDSVYQAPTLSSHLQSETVSSNNDGIANDPENSDEEAHATSSLANTQDVTLNYSSEDHEMSPSVNIERQTILENLTMSSGTGTCMSSWEMSRKIRSLSTKEIRTEDYMRMDLTERIHHCLDYSRACAQKGESPAVTSNFYVLVNNPPSTIHQTLRIAAREGIAHLVWSETSEECYALGVQPVPVPSGYPYSVIARPQWWVDLSDAEIRTGPGADETQIHKAQTPLQEKEKRQGCRKDKRSTRMTSALRKLEEGLRRQKQGLPMCDSNDEGMDIVEG